MRILLVEDEQKLSSFIRKGLAAERFAVDVAEDGAAGVELAVAQDYDLVILDLMIPKLPGAEVVRGVRVHHPNLPILVLTARDTLQDKLKLFECGCDDYLTKPFAFAELVMRVKALLRRASVQRTDKIRVLDLELDRITRRVVRAGKMIGLTVKEFVLLEYLMANENQVCSRNMIIEHVWDQTFDGFTNVVDVYIRYLRNKVDRDFEPPLIHTVRGVGYVLSEKPQ